MNICLFSIQVNKLEGFVFNLYKYVFFVVNLQLVDRFTVVNFFVKKADVLLSISSKNDSFEINVLVHLIKRRIKRISLYKILVFSLKNDASNDALIVNSFKAITLRQKCSNLITIVANTEHTLACVFFVLKIIQNEQSSEKTVFVSF